MAIAGAEGDIEAGCERVTSPMLKVVSKWELDNTTGDYKPSEGRTMKEHTSTVTMFFNRDSGVRTCRLISAH